MTRRTRILLELLGPAPVATLTAALIAAFASPRALADPKFLGGVLVVLGFAYVLAAIPSVLFALGMEFAFSRGLDPASWGAVLLAAGLGFLSGGGIGWTFRGDGWLSALTPLGAFAGAIVGLLVRYRSIRRPASASR